MAVFPSNIAHQNVCQSTHGSICLHVRLPTLKRCVSEPWKGARDRQAAMQQRKVQESSGTLALQHNGGLTHIAIQAAAPASCRRRGGRTENQFYCAAVKEVKHLLTSAKKSFFFFSFPGQALAQGKNAPARPTQQTLRVTANLPGKQSRRSTGRLEERPFLSVLFFYFFFGEG